MLQEYLPLSKGMTLKKVTKVIKKIKPPNKLETSQVCFGLCKYFKSSRTLVMSTSKSSITNNLTLIVFYCVCVIFFLTIFGDYFTVVLIC